MPTTQDNAQDNVVDYKSTLFLPTTGFEMKAGLPRKEPELLKEWQAMDLFTRLRAQSKALPKFILHDGPPYANGNIHIGTALNKILKDIINRSRQMLGYDAHYIPGWDCHGLPIEWKIEEQYRAKGKDKNEVPILEFRQQCREFAAYWLNEQRQEFKRLGVIGDWDNPYSTMNFAAEAQIAEEIGKFLLSGSLYRGVRPVMWSVVERTALAEAELEYKEITSPTIMVSFKVVNSPITFLGEASVVIWTTTPWTIPANRALAAGKDIDYVAVKVTEVSEGSVAGKGKLYLVAKALLDSFTKEAAITSYDLSWQGKGEALDGLVCQHPWRGQGYDFDVPLLFGDFVTTEAGTGFVHIAPSHGTDDWALALANKVEIAEVLGLDGVYKAELPLLAGAVVIDQQGKYGNANGLVMKYLAENGTLLAKSKIRHQYPHSWRSRAPLIFLTTPQWFISMNENDLRGTALRGIEATQFYPPQGKNRLQGMIAARPDWCISRQRSWGVPIPVFVHRQTNQPLRDKAVVDRVVEAFQQEGGDAWYNSPKSRFLGRDYAADDYDQVMDVVDVWFDSGSTHAFCLEPRAKQDLAWPADLYLEGSDQHRGWFHSSLLESCGTRGIPPFKAILTHGFVMDQDGRKMSKSLGNQVFPQEVMKDYGADILRLWVISENYFGDLRIGPSTLKHVADYYRRFRNCLRWLLGNLAHAPQDWQKITPPLASQALLERWLYSRMFALDKELRTAAHSYDMPQIFRLLLQFCTVDLSAFYFDIRKDSLYCDGPNHPRRLASLAALHHLFVWLTDWLAPVLCFTSEEAWQEYRKLPSSLNADKELSSVHLRVHPECPSEWQDEKAAASVELIRSLRKEIYAVLEPARQDGKIGSSLEAAPLVTLPASWIAELQAAKIDESLLAEFAITSGLRLQEGKGDDIIVEFTLANGDKCPRCWTIHRHKAHHIHLQGLCARCDEGMKT